MAAPPASLISSAVSSMVSGRRYGDGLPRPLRPVQYTVAPASPSARAMPRPAPRVAPATSATCPCSGVCAVLDPVLLSYSGQTADASTSRHSYGVGGFAAKTAGVLRPAAARWGALNDVRVSWAAAVSINERTFTMSSEK